MGRAESLQSYTLYYGDPGAIRTDLQRYQAVTRDDVLRVARQYLRPDNRAVVVTIPGRTQ